MSQPSVSAIDAVSPRRGAEVLLEVLISEGVEYIFGNPGTTELPLMDALLRTPQVNYVLALQEASAVAMADGYAQAARKPGFLNLHTAGGLGHGMGNLLNAQVAQTPLVVTAGQQDSRHMLADPLLYGNLVGIAAPAVKFAQEVTNVRQLPILLRRSFNEAKMAPTGPVFLSLPMDIMAQATDIDSGKASQIDHRPIAGSLPKLAHYLSATTPGKVAIVAGHEVHASDAVAEVVAVAELLGAPVYGASWPLQIPFPTAHPLWSGTLPLVADQIAKLLSQYDVVFALGGKSAITILYSETPAVPAGCELYQLSADGYDLGRTYSTNLSLVGDIKASLQVLLPMLREKTVANAQRYQALLEEAGQHHKERRHALWTLAENDFKDPLIAPRVAAREVLRAVGPKVAIVDEAPATMPHARAFLHSDSPAQYTSCRGGGLGWGMPAAVGYSLGLGREPVVCLVGDGAAMYSPQALWTAAHEQLPITFVVMNNREYNILKNFMRSQVDYVAAQTGRFIAMELSQPAIDYVALAVSLGVSARRIERATDIAPAIEAGIASGRPNLVEVIIRPE